MKLRKFVLPIMFVVMLSAGLRAQLPERYTTYSQTLTLLSQLQTQYPEICRLDTMGYSTRDSIPMLRFKISDNVGIDEDEPAIFYCGGVHADEVLGVEVVMYFIQDFFRRYALQDTLVENYLNNLEIFCIPMVNPEGHLVVEGGDMDWRKNKCDNNHNGLFDFRDGVDNNRNYDFGWSLDDEPDALVPESLQYKGTAPFTQTENIHMRDFAWRYRPLVALDYHSPTYGRAEKAYYNWYWYAPEGHGMAPDEAMMADICRQYCSRITNDRGDSTYEARRGLVNKGDLKTYLYGNFGTVAFTVEISDTTIQDPVKVDTICIHHLPSQYYLLGRALGPGITGVIRDSVTLEPIEAEVQVSERINSDIRPRLSRPDFGRYRRVLAPGTYTLRVLKTGYRTRTVSNVVVNNSRPTVTDILLAPLNPRPPAPALLFPENDSVFSGQYPTFVWRAPRYASRYLLEISSDTLFSNLVFFDSTLTDTTFALDTPLQDTLLYWRVKGGNNYGWGPYSEERSFVIRMNAPPPAPVLLYPADDSTFSGIMPTMIWRPLLSAQSYLLEISYDSLFENYALRDSSLADTVFAWPEPEFDTLYFWRVKAGNNFGWGPYSETRSFMLLLYSGIEDDGILPSEIALLQNYPNPFNPETSIWFRIPSGDRGQLTIYDLGGRQVREYALMGQPGQAWQSITWNGRDSAGETVKSGVYFYRLKTNERTLGRKMILLK